MNHEIEQILQKISVYLPNSRIVQAVIIVLAAVLLISPHQVVQFEC